jgi:NADH:ubiquinone oxidoreductase subunit E
MSDEKKKMQITLCMGSSCYPRGNEDNLKIIQHYIEVHDLNETVELAGHRCQDHCKRGPNLMVNGNLHNDVSTAVLPALLRELLPSFKADDETADTDAVENIEHE